MNTKKILRYVVCAAAAAAAMGGAASAQVTLNTTSIQEGVVTLSGTADGDFVTYKVYKAGEEPDKDGMAAFGEIKTDASGAFSLAFELGESGTFEAVLYDGSEYKTIELEFADAQSRADFIERLNSVLSDPSAVLALLNDEQNSAVLNTIGVPADTFGAYPAALQSKICERISSDNAGSTLTENTFLSSYREAAACESMNYDASEYAEAVLAEMNFEYEGEKYGDMVRVFNHRGEVRLPAKVTPRILPGVSAMGQGAWHEANMSGDKIDHGGCVNTLTTLRPSPLAKGNPQHTNLVEIEKI